MNLEPQVLEVPDAVRLLDEQSYFRVEAFGRTAAGVLARNDLDLGPCDGFHELGLKAPDPVGIMYR